ncbi:metalloprotease PmbA [Candidatus Phycosocius bacilliformis]|uniref:Metalloprotease PmbA n=1 Tax=Candidatus Phycosocius bacilliformis TaxID=1445552 RepID=A0A2P2E934_9PROT|nr:metallopeptidase TldD-related protein [Candidatus Phycosocius bacilliformis]GBF57572.1 metalloprotease PmbA [Candidatus Phycosocius bacilliformis]
MSEHLEAAVDRLLSRAKALGAEGADAACVDRKSLSVSVRLGHLEAVESEESRSAGLRVLIGKKQAGASTSDFSLAALDSLAERVVAMAKAAAEDPWCGLPEPNELARDPVDLSLWDETEPDIASLEARALESEAAALAIPGITNSGGAGAEWGASQVFYGASNGFRGGYRGTSWGVGLSTLAEKDDHKERDWDSDSSRFVKDLRASDAIGRRAAERTLARMGATKLESCTAPVIFENRVASRLIGFFLGAISGAAIARGVSFLRDKLHQQVFAPGFTITDDPLEQGGWSSHPFDGEGLPVAARNLVTDGVLQTWLLNQSSARQLGLTSTGHASLNPGGSPGISSSNVRVLPGRLDVAGLQKEAGTGLRVVETLSPSFNPNTGDYSVGVSGLWFENGEIVRPVNEITVAGNMLDIYARLVAGNDYDGRSSLQCPSLLVPSMTIAGA